MLNPMPGFQFDNVCKSATDSDGQVVSLLKNIDLELPENAIHALIGPSGGGKSTLLRLCNRLDAPDSGTIRFDGKDIADSEPLQLRRRIALVPQTPFMFPGSALENLQQPFRWLGDQLPGADSDIVRRNLQTCQFDPEMLKRDARHLSIGQQQRLAIARALMLEPQALLLDEPTSALDRPTAERFALQLQEIGSRLELAVVLVSHDLDLVRRIADRVVFVAAGRIVASGSVREILDQPEETMIRDFMRHPEVV